MTELTVHKKEGFTTISNYLFHDNRISYKAKGLLVQMLSLPKDWDYSVFGLSSMAKDNRDSVMSAIDELKKAGYIEVTHVKNATGQFIGWHYDVYETPKSENPILEQPKSENPTLEKPTLENPQQLNTNIIKDLNNKYPPISARVRVKEILFDNEEALLLTLTRNNIIDPSGGIVAGEALHAIADPIIEQYADWLIATGREDIDRIGRIGVKTQFSNWLRIESQQKKEEQIQKIKEQHAKRNATDNGSGKVNDRWAIDRPYLSL